MDITFPEFELRGRRLHVVLNNGTDTRTLLLHRQIIDLENCDAGLEAEPIWIRNSIIIMIYLIKKAIKDGRTWNQIVNTIKSEILRL